MILNDGQVPAITDFRVLIKYEIYKAYLSKGNRIRIFLGLVSPQLDSNTLTNAIFNLASSSLLIATVSGVYFATSELRNGSASYALVSSNNRLTWILSKIGVATLFGLLVTAIAEFEVVMFGNQVLNSLGIHFDFFTSEALIREIGFGLTGVFGSLIGVGLGLLVKTQLTAVISVIVYTIGFETWLLGVDPKLAKYLIGGGYESITRDPTQSYKLPLFLGYLLLIFWATLFLGLGTFRTFKSDIQWKEN